MDFLVNSFSSKKLVTSVKNSMSRLRTLPLCCTRWMKTAIGQTTKEEAKDKAVASCKVTPTRLTFKSICIQQVVTQTLSQALLALKAINRSEEGSGIEAAIMSSMSALVGMK